MKAAVLPAFDAPIETRDDVEIAPPGPGAVRIKVMASGVCHSDLSVQNGTIPLPTPIVLGHEGSGIVEEIGEGVTRLAVGDHVVLSFVPACGECYTCTHGQPYICEKSAAQAAGGLLDMTTRLTSGGAPLHQMACLGTYGQYAIVPEISVSPVARFEEEAAAKLAVQHVASRTGAEPAATDPAPIVTRPAAQVAHRSPSSAPSVGGRSG